MISGWALYSDRTESRNCSFVRCSYCSYAFNKVAIRYNFTLIIYCNEAVPRYASFTSTNPASQGLKIVRVVSIAIKNCAFSIGRDSMRGGIERPPKRTPPLEIGSTVQYHKYQASMCQLLLLTSSILNTDSMVACGS